MASKLDTLKDGIVTQIATITPNSKTVVAYRGPEENVKGVVTLEVVFGTTSRFDRSMSGIVVRIVNVDVLISGSQDDNSQAAEDVELLFLAAGAGTSHQALRDLDVGFQDMVPVNLVEVDQDTGNDSQSMVSFDLMIRYRFP